MANVYQPTHCDFCGRELPPQQGLGRKRRYCDAPCRSAARRRRAAELPAPLARPTSPASPTASPTATLASPATSSAHVNESLTTETRKSIVDTVPEQPGALAAVG